MKVPKFRVRVAKYERAVRTCYGTTSKFTRYRTASSYDGLVEAVEAARALKRSGGLKRVRVLYRDEVVVDRDGKIVGEWLARYREEKRARP